jgi:hypothetical protein
MIKTGAVSNLPPRTFGIVSSFVLRISSFPLRRQHRISGCENTRDTVI